MGTTVDVQLVILIIPLETPPCLADGDVVLSVGLQFCVSDGWTDICFDVPEPTTARRSAWRRWSWSPPTGRPHSSWWCGYT